MQKVSAMYHREIRKSRTTEFTEILDDITGQWFIRRRKKLENFPNSSKTLLIHIFLIVAYFEVQVYQLFFTNKNGIALFFVK